MCHGLTTGESYVFRVRAVNAAGLSECSQESEALEVKAAIGEFIRGNMALSGDRITHTVGSQMYVKWMSYLAYLL